MANSLSKETSPYLLQHANNPVDWYPWGQEALQKAQIENKLIVISIGYAACHWCHVMEHESFEDATVAQVMNEHFISIKVDREERPDIDKTYMEAVQLMTGRGGWPLNCIALPDGTPVWGGTYFPKTNWIDALKQLANLYQHEPQKALDSAANIKDYMQRMGQISKADKPASYTKTHLENLLGIWLERVDFKFGGRKVSANKFPLPLNNLFLLRSAFFTQNPSAAAAVDTTLEKMAQGGIYDHLQGGFARYSVDPYWKVPHFEKMLYDNAQLVSLYAEAFAYERAKYDTSDPGHLDRLELYRNVVYQTLAFVSSELTSEEGGFYSSLDADSEGEEGKYYVWTFEEVKNLLGADAKLFADYYNVHPYGNWEGKNILFVLESEREFAERWRLDIEDFKQKMATGRAKLLDARSQRIKPGLDDKILTSWNALMLKGYIDAYRIFQEEDFLTTALTHANFLKNSLTEAGKLYRNYKAGKRTIPGFLDDYAYLIDAYIALYQVTFDESWLQQAQLHIDYVLQHFSHEENGMFYFISNEEPYTVKRHVEVQDDVTPASNSVLAHSLRTLGLLLHRSDYLDRVNQMLANVRSELLKNPEWHALWAQLMLMEIYPAYEIAITGKEALKYRMKFEQKYYPYLIFSGAAQPSDLPILQNRFQSDTTIYVCEHHTCKLPVNSVESAWEQIQIGGSEVI